jgi:hypothetical protein
MPGWTRTNRPTGRSWSHGSESKREHGGRIARLARIVKPSESATRNLAQAVVAVSGIAHRFPLQIDTIIDNLIAIIGTFSSEGKGVYAVNSLATRMKNAAVLMDATRNRILQKYQVTPEARLSSGMEAEVYTYGSDAVLKLYVGTASHADLLTLQDFYNALDRQHVPYALPRIHAVAQEAGFLRALRCPV